jgi:galactonate dehydratase
MIDFHGTCDVSTSIRMTRKFEDYDPFWIEEPVPPEDMDGLAEVRNSINTPVAAGEQLQTVYDFKTLFEKRAADIVQPEAAIAGGLTESRRIAVMADVWNLLVSPHGWSNAVGLAAALHLAASIPNMLIFEFRRSYNPLMHDILVDPIEPKKGFVEVPNKPGLGIELDEKAMKKYPFVPGPLRVF